MLEPQELHGLTLFHDCGLMEYDVGHIFVKGTVKFDIALSFPGCGSVGFVHYRVAQVDEEEFIRVRSRKALGLVVSPVPMKHV